MRHWTLTTSDDAIRQGQGIPQGPLASGLLAEVVLSFFDEKHPQKRNQWIYFRYVDDIRFFARSERSLRQILVDMDLLCKQIGLFPQTSKIEIHRVENIEDEIKSVHYPPEEVVLSPSPDQTRVRKRLIELSPRCVLSNETRFKYVLGGALPDEKLSKRLIRILRKHPHLYREIFQYFAKYNSEFSFSTSKLLFEVIEHNNLYDIHTAAGLRILRRLCHERLRETLVSTAVKILKRSNLHPELFTICVCILLDINHFSFTQIEDYVLNYENWWVKTQLIRNIRSEQIGDPSYNFLIASLLRNSSNDVALTAVEIFDIQSIKGTLPPTSQINPLAQYTLQSMGYIGKRKDGTCPISDNMCLMLSDTIKSVEWKKILGRHYNYDISKCVRLRAYSQQDSTKWINLIDTIHDDILDALFYHDSSIGSYQHGNMGGTLGNSTSAFALKYPKTRKLFNYIHKKRLKSELSHSVIKSKRVGKIRTGIIEFSIISKLKTRLEKAYLEIWSKW